MMSHAGIRSEDVEALFDVGITINMISTSEIRVTVLLTRLM